MRTIERPAVASAVAPPIERRSSSTPWWVGLGVLTTGILVYVMAAWVLSGDFERTPTGADPVPSSQKIYGTIWQVLGVCLLIGAITYFWRRTRREGRIPVEGLVYIAWTINIWMDPVSNNYVRPQLLYNSSLINFGSWAPHVPGWLSPNAHLLPEPIVAYSGVYGSQVLLSLIGVWVMRRAKQRWPEMGKLGQVLSCLAAIMLVDLVLEVTLIRTGLWSYAGAVKSLSLFAGTRYQFPIYETFVFGSILTASAALMHFKDDKGRSFVERGIDETRLSRRQVEVRRIMAVAGFTFVIYAGYSLVYCWASIYGGPYPKDMPSYMLNGMCGPGTDYACMSPQVPIVIPDSGPLPDGSPAIAR